MHPDFVGGGAFGLDIICHSNLYFTYFLKNIIISAIICNQIVCLIHCYVVSLQHESKNRNRGKDESADYIPHSGIHGGCHLGIYVCVYQIAVAGWFFASTDFYAALPDSLCDVVGVLSMARYPLGGRHVERRVADDGTGHNGRLTIFHG